jgi:hypothetical protein
MRLYSRWARLLPWCTIAAATPRESQGVHVSEAGRGDHLAHEGRNPGDAGAEQLDPRAPELVECPVPWLATRLSIGVRRRAPDDLAAQPDPAGARGGAAGAPAAPIRAGLGPISAGWLHAG